MDSKNLLTKALLSIKRHCRSFVGGFGRHTTQHVTAATEINLSAMQDYATAK